MEADGLDAVKTWTQHVWKMNVGRTGQLCPCQYLQSSATYCGSCAAGWDG